MYRFIENPGYFEANLGLVFLSLISFFVLSCYNNLLTLFILTCFRCSNKNSIVFCEVSKFFVLSFVSEIGKHKIL